MNILLIEPDKILGEAIKKAVEAFGHTVLVRRNAQTALDSLDETVPDLIILELQLGIHNGIEFLYEIRSYSEWQKIPVVIHTINPKAGSKTFERALNELGVVVILYKPRTTIAQLVKFVKQFQMA